MTSLQQDIYGYWGYRFDYKEGDGKKSKQLYERLLEEIPLSLTEQREQLLDLLDTIVGAIVEECCPAKKPPEDWDWKGIKSGYIEHFASKPPEVGHLHDPEHIAKVLFDAAEKHMKEKETETGTELLLRVLRHLYLEEIDRQWVDHLTNMEHLRDGIGLRGYGQRDPKQEYKKEGYDVFITMMAATSSNVCTKLFQVQVRKETDVERIEREDAEKHARQQRAMQMRHGGEGGGRRRRGASRGARVRRPGPSRASRSSRRAARGRRSGATTLVPAAAGRSSRSATARPWKTTARAEAGTTRRRSTLLWCALLSSCSP